MQAWQALDYVRQRDLLERGDLDYGRQRHQQQFIKAVFKEMLSGGTLTNRSKLAAVSKTVGKAMTLDTRHIPIADWVFAMKSIGGNDILTIKTNDGKLNPGTSDNGQSVEKLSADSLQLLQTVKEDRVDAFVAVHADWVAN
jgi:anionic cell wall polymer biosynthesis LytR-Cps2A-Psr (LCP) family protein